jgi:hypothetical protein
MTVKSPFPLDSLVRGVSLAFALAMLGSCGGDDEAQCGGFADVHGTWSGSWTGASGAHGPAVAVFTQSGSTLSGTITLSGTSCPIMGPIDGTICNQALSLTETSMGNTVGISLTLSGSTMTGRYDVVGGQCLGDRATISLTR